MTGSLDNSAGADEAAVTGVAASDDGVLAGSGAPVPPPPDELCVRKKSCTAGNAAMATCSHRVSG